MKITLFPKLTDYKIPFFILLFLCFSSVIFGDCIVEALLLSHFDTTIISKMYMVNAVFLFISSLFIMSLIDRVDRGLFFMVFLFVHCIVLFVLWIAVFFGITILFIPMFSYAYITKIFMFLMFWTLTNDIVDSRKAGKDFPFIAAGGTLGAIGVSFAIPWLLKVIQAESLLLLWALLSLCIACCFIPINRSFGTFFRQISDTEKHKSRSIKSIVEDIIIVSKEPLLANMSLLYFLIFFALFNQHYNFYESIKIHLVEVKKLASFLGYFSGVSMVLTFLLQVTLTGIIIKKIGSTRSMFLLPVIFSLVFGTLSVISLIYGNAQGPIIHLKTFFYIIVMGVGIRIAFFDSFFSPNFQLFFSSLPHDIRGKGKLVIEGIVKPSAMVFTSLWLIFIAGNIPFSINMLLLFLVSAAMIYQTFKLRIKYTESLTQHLSNFKSRFLSTHFTEMIDGKEGLSGFSKILENESFEIKCYIIEILSGVNTKESIDLLIEYVPKADKRTRSVIISSLAKLKIDRLKSFFISMLEDSDTRVVANAITTLGSYNDPEINRELNKYLKSENNRIRANTVMVLWPVSNETEKKVLYEVLKKMLESEDTLKCSSALYAIGDIGFSEDIQHLFESFFFKRYEEVKSARHLWRQSLWAIGKNISQKLIEQLLEISTNVNKKKRKDISGAILNACNNGLSIKTLLSYLNTENNAKRNMILKVLSLTNLKITRELENNFIAIAHEEEDFINLKKIEIDTLNNTKTSDAVQLLANAILEEYVELHIKNLMYMAIILDKSGQLKQVIRRIKHENKHIRAGALEVLDNSGNSKINRILLRLVDPDDESSKKLIPTTNHSSNKQDTSSIITKYSNDSNIWIQQCALYALRVY